MCRNERAIARWFDGEAELTPALETHLEECASCRNYLAFLRTMRDGVGALPTTPKISDGQFTAFMDPIRSDLERHPRRWFGGLWAVASVATAALIASASLLYIFDGQPEPVSAETVIETSSTEIEGATTEAVFDDDGTATVWVRVPEGELW